ncbi:carbohydrate ABC transporter permease [Halorussus salinus]|uniref:carbohydrate ABC transporter permease n=1 Tax=Halorussus salinus TaxID=1364935 RepID=UPI00138EE202|nr:sugar ABC transporter permease [Halorussus salinus]
MLLPDILIFSAFVFLPVVYAFWLSFHEAYFFSSQFQWVGLAHYNDILFHPLAEAAGIVVEEGPVAAYEFLTDPLRHPFLASLKNNVYFGLLSIPGSVIAGLGLALLVNTQLKGIKYIRTVYFLPVVTSMIVVALVFNFIYNPTYGLLNWLLTTTGILNDGVIWLADYPILAIVAMTIWKGAGYNMLLYLAALQGLPTEVYKAARIDGAGRIARFKNITWPLLKPTTLFIVVMTTIGSFKVFTQVYVMTEGGPGFKSTVAVYYIYEKAFGEYLMGEASAMSFVLFGIIFVVTVINMRYLNTDVEY